LIVNRGADGGIFQTVYSGTTYNTIRNHNNGNISISATGQGLYVGYENTTLMNWLNGNMSLTKNTGLKITQNSNTVTIGSLNSNYCHFENSANIPFYFNKSIYING
jgi:hypothetical protein